MGSLCLAMILLPLAGSILNGLILRPSQPKRAGVLATAFAAGSFACAISLWLSVLNGAEGIAISFDWFHVGNFELKWGFAFDRLTSVMALVVTGIGTLIHAYSIGYMSHEKTPSRYFAYLNLFLFNMLVLITGDNLAVLFVGWEGVGLCSYLLIGYWYQDVEKANAGMKAFLVNRIGDAGFLLGIFLCFQMFGSVSFSSINASLASGTVFDPRAIELAALFLFIGAMGKSAQIPLYVWLPDAMAGPTPVSALIHAATMVTAGVYLTVRMNALYSIAPLVSTFIAWIGVATALLAAFIATSQKDIKKVLAYSTVSQLGLMFLAVGSGAYVAAVFHLVTHAFFKALLFLGAGSVIHALEGEQDIHKMGGLRKSLPWTFWTCTIGTAAICGLPPLSGFFSKDLILYSAQATHHGNGMVFWALGSFASLLTAFYMTRMYSLVFLGTYRGHEHPHESPAVMTVPLFVLAVGSAVAGFLELPHGFPLPTLLSHYLSPIIPEVHEIHGFMPEFTAMGIATAGAVLSVSLALVIFGNLGRAEALGRLLRPLQYVFENKFFVDELYGIVFLKPFQMISSFLARFFDPKVVDAAVVFPTRVCRAGANMLSFFQLGSAQFYLLVMTLGALGVLWVSLRHTVGL